MYVIVPFLTTKHLDFTGLNNIVAYDTASLESLRIHPSCMLVTVVTVMSPINPLLNARQISVIAWVPLFAALIIMLKHDEQFDKDEASMWQYLFEASDCESAVWEPQMVVNEVIHKEVTWMVWDVVLMHSHFY